MQFEFNNFVSDSQVYVVYDLDLHEVIACCHSKMLAQNYLLDGNKKIFGPITIFDSNKSDMPKLPKRKKWYGDFLV